MHTVITYRTPVASPYCNCTTPIWRHLVSIVISVFLDIPYGCEHERIVIEPDMLKGAMTFAQFMFTDDPWLGKTLYFDAMM